MYIKRHIEGVVEKVKNTYPVTLITGPRQVGKSTLLRNLYPDISYETLDDPLLLRSISLDPVGYLKLQGTPFIIDEVQRAPELFLSLKYIVDTNRANGMYFLSGSQKFELMQNVGESLSGRISVIELWGLSAREIYGDSFNMPFLPTIEYLSARQTKIPSDIKELWKRIHKGSMPRLYDDVTVDTERYYADYVNTYIERDIQRLEQVGNGLTFLHFLIALAARTGELLNLNSVAKEVGVSLPTAKKWVSVLQKSNIIYLLYPFSLNVNKRMVKAPKLYFTDTGLVAYLCKWLTPETLLNGAMSGSVFETYVIGEVVKSYINAGKEPNIYYYRDSNGCEVDLLIVKDGTIYPIEIKKTSAPNLKDIKHFKTLKDAYPDMQIGEGGVICSYDKVLPLDKDDRVIPVGFI